MSDSKESKVKKTPKQKGGCGCGKKNLEEEKYLIKLKNKIRN